MRRNAYFALAVVILGFIVAEVLLRYLPVDTGLGTMQVDAGHPVMHFTPNRDFIYSRGWDLENVNRGHVNNDGWINDQDYHVQGPHPLIAIVGDSYIEASMIPYRHTVQALLAQKMGNSGRVYSFGVSGAALSQYIAMAEYAAKKYKPDGIIVNVIGNDFDESLLSYKRDPGFQYFAQTDHGLQLHLVNYIPRHRGALLVRSALGRYLALNLQLKTFVTEMLNPASYGGNKPTSLDDKRVADSFAVIPAFLSEIVKRTGLPPPQILLVVDGVRPDLYDDPTGGAKSYFGVMRGALLNQANHAGFETLDLQPVFLDDYRKHHQRLEFARDDHWNEYGHAVVANAIEHTVFFKSIANESRGTTGQDSALPGAITN
jgi:hypothetical protein